MNKKFLPIKSTFFDDLIKRDNFFKDNLFDDFFNFKSSLPALNVSEDDYYRKLKKMKKSLDR